MALDLLIRQFHSTIQFTHVLLDIHVWANSADANIGQDKTLVDASPHRFLAMGQSSPWS